MGIDVVVDAAAGTELTVFILPVETPPVDMTLLEMLPIDGLDCPPGIMVEPLDIPGEDVMLAICELEDPVPEEDWLNMLLDDPADELWTPA